MGGGKELLERIETIEREIESIKTNVATETNYGSARISRSEDVTEDDGLVLGAWEKNASNAGSIMSRISELESGRMSLRQMAVIGLSTADGTVPAGGSAAASADISGLGFKKAPYAAVVSLGWCSLHSVRVSKDSVNATLLNPYDSIHSSGVTLLLIEPL